MMDQAATVRKMNPVPFPQNIPQSTRCQLIGITSGKGGVGKTNVVVNLALALSRAGKKVAIFDADLGLANVDVFLGLTPTFHIGHVVEGVVPLKSIIMEGPENIDIIPASSGIQELSELDERRRFNILEQLQEILESYDFLLIDTAAGISSNVVRFLNISRRIIVVCAPEPTAIVDAYALIKTLVRRDADKEIWVLVNSVRNSREAEEVFEQLKRVAEQFLEQSLKLLGFIPRDEKVCEAVRRQEPLLIGYPRAMVSRCFTRIAKVLIDAAPVTTRLTRLWQGR